MAPLEIWSTSAGIPGYTARHARRVEEDGFDGLGLVDSQNLAGDPWVELAMAAAATQRIGLATAVTNPVTRHPAAAAAAAVTVQAESGGRVVLGIGRGDSSLAHLGLAPAPVAVFRRYLERLQAYLGGADVPFDVEAEGPGLRPSGELGMAGGPTASRLRWAATVAKVPVDVAATGPKVIELAAALADRVTLAVGAAPERIHWGVDVARRAAGAAGRGEIPIGAYLPVVVHPDREVARRLISGGVASFARFSVMHGTVTGPVAGGQAQVLEQIHDTYDMDRHFTDGSPQSAGLTPEVIDAFGVAGPPDHCIERLAGVVRAGVSKLILLGGGIGADRDEMRRSQHLLATEVLPALRAISS